MKHGVYFYEDDTFLIDSVADFAKEGLERQETVIIVATEQHRGRASLFGQAMHIGS
jgi:hypothetical protein